MLQRYVFFISNNMWDTNPWLYVSRRKLHLTSLWKENIKRTFVSVEAIAVKRTYCTIIRDSDADALLLSLW